MTTQAGRAPNQLDHLDNWFGDKNFLKALQTSSNWMQQVADYNGFTALSELSAIPDGLLSFPSFGANFLKALYSTDQNKRLTGAVKSVKDAAKIGKWLGKYDVMVLSKEAFAALGGIKNVFAFFGYILDVKKTDDKVKTLTRDLSNTTNPAAIAKINLQIDKNKIETWRNLAGCVFEGLMFVGIFFAAVKVELLVLFLTSILLVLSSLAFFLNQEIKAM